VQSVADDTTVETVIVALETADRELRRDELPIRQGGVLHRLAEAVSGFSLSHANVKLGELIGGRCS
jgi:hypothetical protein